MGKFDIDGFRRALGEFRSLKQERPEYDYREWRIDKGDAKCPASRCAEIMAKVKAALEGVRDEWEFSEAIVHCSAGSGYYPDVPWIGIMFGDEKPTNGVYPAFGFYADGFIVSCTASFARPQTQFLKLCYTKEEIKRLKADNGDPISEYVNRRMAKDSITWFAYRDDAKLTEERIKAAVRKAIDVHHDYRKSYPDAETTAWFTVEPVESVVGWLEQLAGENNDNATWVFRGQGDSRWMLETSLGRSLFADGVMKPELDLKGVLDMERTAMKEFQRESARTAEYRSLGNVELLSLMQHYGAKTRLLDFSFSPLVALYFALESHDDYIGHVNSFLGVHGGKGRRSDGEEVDAISVWAVNIDEIRCQGREDSGATLRERLERFHDEAGEILKGESSGGVRAGIAVVIPDVNNERSSAQDGLFLMPCRISKSFEANLLQNEANLKSSHVVRYDFSPKQIEEIRTLLRNLRFTAKQIYPDLTGLAKSLNTDICRMVKKRTGRKV